MTAPADRPADAPATAPKRAMFIVFLIVAIDLLGFGIVLPLVPRYGDTLLAGYSPGAKWTIIGLMYSLFSLMQFVFSPVWGRVSDRVGRRPILLMSLAGSVVFYALFGYASTLGEYPQLAVTLLLLSRVGAGIAGASVSTAAAVIADCTTPERRAKGMALIGAAFGIGFTFGPLVAWGGDELFANPKEGPGAGPGMLAAAISAVALGLAAVLLPETLPPGPKPPRYFFSLSRTREVLRMPTVGALVLIYFLAICGFANFEGTLSLLTKEAFGLSDRDNYLVFAYIGFVLMIAQGGVYRPLAGRLSEPVLLTAGVGMMLLGLLGLALVTYGVHAQGGVTADGLKKTGEVTGGAADWLKGFFYLSVTVAVTGFAFVNPSVSALVSRRADPARQGEVLGVNQSFASLGRIVGPFVGVEAFGLHPSRVLPYVVAAGLLLLVAGLLPAVRNTRFTTEGTEGHREKTTENEF